MRKVELPDPLSRNAAIFGEAVMRTVSTLLLGALLALSGCTAGVRQERRIVYVEDAEVLSKKKPIPGIEPRAAESEHDVVVVFLNGEYLEPMVIDLTLRDERGELFVWKDKKLPRGFATFETDPTPERQLEAGCVAVVRVFGVRLVMSVKIHGHEAASKHFELECNEGESIGAMATYQDIRFVHNKQAK